MASLYEQQQQQQQHAMMPTSMNDHTMYPTPTPMNHATANEVYHTTCNNQQFMENNTYASGILFTHFKNNDFPICLKRKRKTNRTYYDE